MFATRCPLVSDPTPRKTLAAIDKALKRTVPALPLPALPAGSPLILLQNSTNPTMTRRSGVDKVFLLIGFWLATRRTSPLRDERQWVLVRFMSRFSREIQKPNADYGLKGGIRWGFLLAASCSSGQGEGVIK
jgi:hypothetical protein